MTNETQPATQSAKVEEDLTKKKKRKKKGGFYKAAMRDILKPSQQDDIKDSHKRRLEASMPKIEFKKMEHI